jgi:hypothetical protein
MNGHQLTLTLWTNDPVLAQQADAAGVDRVGLDLERIGKVERQGEVGRCWISSHQEAELPGLGRVLRGAKLFARTNPPHSGSPAEIERLLAAGVQVLMLPMFRTTAEAVRFIELVGGRAEVSLLVEHVDAADRIDELIRLEGVDEIYIGLNDLALSLGVRNRFALLDTPLVALLAEKIRAGGIPFGFGGLGRASDTTLPIPSDLVYAEYARLGASSGLLSQVFLRKEQPGERLAADVRELRTRLDHWYAASPGALECAHSALVAAIRRHVGARV